MKKSSAGFTNVVVVLIVLVVVFAGVAGYFALVEKSPELAQETVSSTPTTTSAKDTAVVTPKRDAPRVIACNPKGFDPDYFKRGKPCTSDMSVTDIARENKALAIITKARQTDKEIPFDASAKLFVSDERYQVIDINLAPRIGYVVVDTVGGNVTDYFTLIGNHFVENSSKRFVYVDGLGSPDTTTQFVRQYTFGTEKSATLADTEVYSPQTYFSGEGPNGSTSVKIVASTANSITLGLYNQDKTSQKPGDDFTQFEQVGTKVINLSN
jgi:hypothetical protein